MAVTLWVAAIVSCIGVAVWFQRRSSLLAHFPGPSITKFTDLWQLWFMYSDVKRKPFHALHQQYGHVVRMGPNKLYFNEPQASKDIFNLRADLRKSDYYPVFAPVADGHVVDNFFASVNPNYHDTIRKAISAPFSMSNLVKFENNVDSVVSELLIQIRNRYAGEKGNGKVIDMSEWCHYFSLDAISKIAYSKSYGFLEKAGDMMGMISMMNMVLIYQQYIGQVPWLDKVFFKNPFLLWLGRIGVFRPVAPPVVFAEQAQRGRLDEAEAKEKASKGAWHRSEGMGYSDILDFMVRLQGKQPELIDEREVLNVGVAVVFAGADSTANMISAIFYLLLKNPQTLARLRQELEDNFGRFTSFDSTVQDVSKIVHPSFEKLQKLPFLDAVIKESMRYYGVIRFAPERITPPGGMTIAGKFVPGGVVVGVSPWTVQYDPELYGQDADVYRPERWLEATPERYREMASGIMIFGQGKYTCLGQNISYLEQAKMVPAIVRAFDLIDADPTKEWTFNQGLFVNLSEINARVSMRNP